MRPVLSAGPPARQASTTASTAGPTHRRGELIPSRLDRYRPALLAAVRSDLPLYVAVGEADPVNGQLALVHALVERYRAAGLTDITLKTYPEARHEVLNETNRAEVVADLLRWLDRVVPTG